MDSRARNIKVQYPLPRDWSLVYCSLSKMQFYINNITKKKQCHRPLGPAIITFSNPIRCSRILIKFIMYNPKTMWWNYVTRSKRRAAGLISKCYVLVISNQFTFGQVAYKYSECKSAINGGDIQWLNSYTVKRNYIHFFYNLEIGQVTLPIQTPEGFEILYRTA